MQLPLSCGYSRVIVKALGVAFIGVFYTTSTMAQPVYASSTNALNAKGNARDDLEDTQGAITDYNQAIKINPNYEYPKNALILLGRSSRDISGTSSRLRVFAQTPKDKDSRAEADRLLLQGLEQYKTNQLEAALQSLQQALKIYREIKDRSRERLALESLGSIYGLLGNYAKVIEYLQQSLAIAQEIDDRERLGSVYSILGFAYLSLENPRSAIEYLQQSLTIVREMKDRQSEIEILGNLGNAYGQQGDYAKAIEYHQQSLAIAQELKDRSGLSNALGNLGASYLYLGDYPEAIKYQEQSLAIAREIKDRSSESIALASLGNAYRNLEDYPNAIKYYQQSLAIAREIKDVRNEASTLGGLGLTFLEQGDYRGAIEYFQKALAIAQSIKYRQLESKVLGNIGLAYLQLEDEKKAIDYFQQLLSISRDIKDRTSESQALHNLGYIFYKQGNLSTSESYLIEAMKVKESLRGKLKDKLKILFYDRQSNTYELLQQVFVAQNKTSDALLIAERGRSRAFVELLQAQLPSNPTQKSPDIEEIKQIARVQNATLVQYSIIYDQLKIQGKQQIKESELYIWVVKPTGEVTFRSWNLKPLWQKNNTSLFDLVTSTRQSIGVTGRGLAPESRPNKNQEQQKLQQLHQILIQPITDLLPKNERDRVVFIPQRELFLVPFSALQDKDGKYLIEKHTILTAPSIQVLDLTRQQRQRVSGNQVLVVGNPAMPSVSPKIGSPPVKLPTLPGSEQEANAIAALFRTKAITGKNATKAEIIKRLPQARIIHLATHGLLDDFEGLGVPGAIALAPDGKDNGLLTANEILDLKINAELVVLSACDTGQGKVTGDGVIGLSRSLITAGAPSVIVTLWSIPDNPSAFLMAEFYQQLQQNPDKAQALRLAMLKTMKQYPNPSAWAAFNLIGEAK